MSRVCCTVLACVALTATPAEADELTLMVEQDLERLGYDTGAVDGEETMETTIAISKFQAENNLDVTGEVSRELARALLSVPEAGAAAYVPASAGQAAAAPPRNEAALHAAQEACLQEKVKAARESGEKKRGLKRLFGAIARTASKFSSIPMVNVVNQVYSAQATADDIKTIAEELGISEDDVRACKNPGAR